MMGLVYFLTGFIIGAMCLAIVSGRQYSKGVDDGYIEGLKDAKDNLPQDIQDYLNNQI
jgi:hypothetical protein